MFVDVLDTLLGTYPETTNCGAAQVLELKKITAGGILQVICDFAKFLQMRCFSLRANMSWRSTYIHVVAGSIVGEVRPLAVSGVEIGFL